MAVASSECARRRGHADLVSIDEMIRAGGPGPIGLIHQTRGAPEPVLSDAEGSLALGDLGGKPAFDGSSGVSLPLHWGADGPGARSAGPVSGAPQAGRATLHVP
jgi:hypothetical protein